LANALATAGNAEAYFEFADDYGGRTAMSLVHAGENVIVLRSSATAHGLAALPFGYAIAPRALYLRRLVFRRSVVGSLLAGARCVRKRTA
jgi:histidinol-phosphate/aromatic aminotransferase/cobyric acid decarboxylase-like protein